MSLDDTFDMFKEEYPDVSEERIDGLKRSFEELEIIFYKNRNCKTPFLYGVGIRNSFLFEKISTLFSKCSVLKMDCQHFFGQFL